MRLFSNIHLHWSEVHVIRYVARCYPGPVMNLYLYRVRNLGPRLQIESHAPLDILQRNHNYYSYHSIGFRPTTNFMRTNTYTLFLDKEQTPIPVYLPSAISVGDILAVQDPSRPKPQEIFLPGLLF